MAIKEYQNKSSVLKRRSRYIQGGVTVLNKKRLGWWEQYIDIPRDDITDIKLYITSDYANRPDLIASDYYDDALLAWIILQYNKIVDVKDELVAGTHITIPSKHRVYYSILTHSVRVQESTG
jgi:hypothetical protein